MTKHIAIIGNSGSGKSTLAKHLTKSLQIQHMLDLDTVAWEPDNPTQLRAHDVAATHVTEFCSQHTSWVVEGCYANLIATTLDFQPELILVDPGVEQCLANCRNRPWEPHKYASLEEQNERLGFLLDWVKDYYQRDGDLSYQAHLALFENYSGPKQHIKDQIEMREL